ncbi:MAG: hypothetical protein WD009_03355 [Phycisphaeraceae bacterium]
MKQRDLYRQLQSLGGRQAELIEQGHTEQLLEVLAQRQRYVQRLAAVNAELAVDRERWPELATTLPADERQRINNLLEEVEALLAAIIAQDDRDRAQLALARDEVAGQMRQAAHAGRAVSAYSQATGSVAARFTDGKG